MSDNRKPVVNAENIGEILKDTLGEVYDVDVELPGVFYVAVKRVEPNFAGREYYIVDPETDSITPMAKKYGTRLDTTPELLSYIMYDEPSQWEVIQYEIYKDRVKRGLADISELNEIALNARENNPRYFGPYPLPSVTPWGYVLRARELGYAYFWIETDSFREVLFVGCPEAGLLSYSTRELAEPNERYGGLTPLEGLYFSKENSCIPVFENYTQLEPYGAVDKAALMNAIIKYHPMYALSYNAAEQMGLNDPLSRLLSSFGIECEPHVSPERAIALSGDENTDFVIWQEP